VVEKNEWANYMGKLKEIWPFRAVGGRKKRVSNESMGVSSRKVDMQVMSLRMSLLRVNSGNVLVDRCELLIADRDTDSTANTIGHVFTAFCSMERSQMLLYHSQNQK
jgi:hypothetical protein